MSTGGRSGNLNAVTCKEIFPLLKDNKLWFGSTCFNGGAAFFYGDKSLYDPSKMYDPKNAFLKDDKFYWRVNGVRWFTNVPHQKRNTPITLCKKYNAKDYPEYDNYNAINVDKTSDIPEDYFGVMGVPISFFDKYCPSQFEIIGLDRYVSDNPNPGHRFNLDGKEMYARILIKRKS